jgi:HK97 family phage prohead protease
MSDFELRPYADPVEIRSSEGGKLVLAGTAIRYGARSKDLGGFRERIMPGAASDLLGKSDVLGLEEHRNYLGRTKNETLRLIDSPTELRYEVDLLDDSTGRDVLARAQRGDYGGSSFGFRAKEVKWSKDDDGTPLRSIHSFSVLRDVGPTVVPAYEPTTAEMVMRSFPFEADVDVEVRSLLDASPKDRLQMLAKLLDGLTLEETPDSQQAPMVIHRRPASWFV